eukprot:GEMP01023329.1.p1 GENE.GEMP01023329.1~~GEMP01023329.1.p1  ORF type:complete len:514 (+),score=168.67 GEMP01023329.1:80-1621(+)
MVELDELMLRTQQSLGSLISKPKMTEKYLRKPPFRFLHDIVMEVGRATGFAQGLFHAQEIEAASMSDKQSKVDFLSKAISCTAFCVEEIIEAAPNKIVAGLEPEKTNAWLIQLHRAATEKLSNNEQAVKRVLSGDFAVAQKKKKEAPAAPAEAPPPAAPPSAEPAAPPAADDSKRKDEEERERRKRKEEEQAKRREADEQKRREQQQQKRQEEQQEEQQRRRQMEEEERRKRKEEEKQQKQRQKELEAQQKREEEEQTREVYETPKPAALSDEIVAKAEELLGVRHEASKMERPRTAGRRPPKVASKEAKPDQPMLATDLILDGDVKKDNDEDFFVVQDSAPQEVLKVGDGEAHGSLVRDLLEQKKKDEEILEPRKGEEEKEEQQGIVMGKLRRKNLKTTTNVDAAKLREAIQQLCQSANPLGKSIDLVHQDLGNMSKELDHWRAEYRDAAQQYQKELKETEQALAPLNDKLLLLNDRWDELQLNIIYARARIIKNDTRVNNLLDSVSLTANY